VAINVHISLNKLTNPSRVLREANTLVDHGVFQKILIFALWDSGLKEEEKYSEGIDVQRIKLRTKRFPTNIVFQLLKYIELIIKIILRLKSKEVTVVNCHGLGALPIGVILKHLKRIALIYDTHELETETHSLRGIRKILSKLTERVFIGFSDVIIVVSDSIKEWYENTYGKNNVVVVRSFPYKKWINRRRSNILKNTFNISDNEVLFIYQGKFAYGRCIETLLNVFSRLNYDKHIVFMGYGQLEEMIKDFAQRYKNIHYHPAVPPDEISSYTKSADVGINLTDNSCLSRYYALSNKLFEYLNSELPVIVSDFPERGRFVDEFSCGWKIRVKDKVSEESVYNFINELTKDEIVQKKENVRKLENIFIWENEEKRLLNVYASLNKQRRR